VRIAAPDGGAACVLAAVTGEILDAPGAALAPLAGAAALTPGLALAARDRCPLILLTDLHADAALLAPVVKATVVVEAASAAHWIAHAAIAGEPALPIATALRPPALPPPTPAVLETLGDALARASRPLLITGLECGADDAKWVRAFAESLPAPVLATAKGRGVLAEPHPLALGLVDAGHPLLARADLLVLVGVDALELPPGPWAPRPLARIGRAPWPESGPAPVADARGDIALVIEELAPRVRARPAADWDVAELDRLKRAVTREARATPASRLVGMVREATPAGTLVASDVALGLAWQAVGPREVLTPLGGHGPVGYAILAAVSAQLVHPARRVVAFTTPIGLSAGSGALALADARELPVVAIVLGPAHDETAFARAVERALATGRPAIVGGACSA